MDNNYLEIPKNNKSLKPLIIRFIESLNITPLYNSNNLSNSTVSKLYKLKNKNSESAHSEFNRIIKSLKQYTEPKSTTILEFLNEEKIPSDDKKKLAANLKTELANILHSIQHANNNNQHGNNVFYEKIRKFIKTNNNTNTNTTDITKFIKWCINKYYAPFASYKINSINNLSNNDKKDLLSIIRRSATNKNNTVEQFMRNTHGYKNKNAIRTIKKRIANTFTKKNNNRVRSSSHSTNA